MIASEIDFAPNATNTIPVALVIQRPYRKKIFLVIGKPVQAMTQAVAAMKPPKAEAARGSTAEHDFNAVATLVAVLLVNNLCRSRDLKEVSVLPSP